MHGEHDDGGIDYYEHEPVRLTDLEEKERKKKLDRAMKAEIKKPDLDQELRKKGLI